MYFVWTGKGRKASESLYEPKNTELFWTIFYICSKLSLQYDRKGEVELGLGEEFDIFC